MQGHSAALIGGLVRPSRLAVLGWLVLAVGVLSLGFASVLSRMGSDAITGLVVGLGVGLGVPLMVFLMGVGVIIIPVLLVLAVVFAVRRSRRRV